MPFMMFAPRQAQKRHGGGREGGASNVRGGCVDRVRPVRFRREICGTYGVDGGWLVNGWLNLGRLPEPNGDRLTG